MALALIQMRGVSGIQRWINAINFFTASTPSLHPYKTAQQLVEKFRTIQAAKYIAALPTDSKLTHISARVVDPAGGYTAWHRYSFTQGWGLRTGSFSNNAVSPVLLGFNSVQARRVAKVFFAAVSDADIDGNLFSNGLLSNIANFGNSLTDGSLTSEGGVIAWRWAIQASPSGPVRPVEGMSMAGIVGTQRGRRQFI